MNDAAELDFIALAEAGVALRTRDRRMVSDVTIDRAAGLIRGSLPLEGTLAWRRDGSYAEAPRDVAGPFDLVAPAPAPATTQRASLQDALNDEDAVARAPFCCD